MEQMAESFRLAGEAPDQASQSVQAAETADLPAFLTDFVRRNRAGSLRVTGVSYEQGDAYLRQLKSAGYQGILPESIQQGYTFCVGNERFRLDGRYEGSTLYLDVTPLGENRRAMTDGELTQLNEWLSSTREEANNVVYAAPVNGFFLSSYQNVRDLDFVDFLAYFPGEAGEITDAEFQALTALDNWPFDKSTLAEMPVPIHRIPAKTVDETLTEYAGITTADLWDRSGVCYLPETDAYYNFTSDFGPGYFQADYGETTGESAWLWYGSDCLTLGRETDGWKIRSYQGPWEAHALREDHLLLPGGPGAERDLHPLPGEPAGISTCPRAGRRTPMPISGATPPTMTSVWKSGWWVRPTWRRPRRRSGTPRPSHWWRASRATCWGDDGKTVLHVRFYEGGYGTFAVLCRYPAEAAEGGGVRLQVIADTFRAKGAS